jgi:aldehyde:ferredoxin oxidoreductase
MDSDDPAVSAKFHLLCNQLGLDADTACVTPAWAYECYEKGLLTKQETDDLELKWGNDDAWLELVTKIAHRRGIGDLLADGVLEASRKLGKGSETLIAHCKSQDTIESFRGGLAWALGVATSPVGGHHLRGAVGPGISGPKNLDLMSDKIMNQADAVFWELRAKEIEDMTGECVFMGTFSGAYALGPVDYTELINSALGTDFTEAELMQLGQSAYNLEKAFNAIHTDFDRKDDYPPERFFREAISSGPLAGMKVEKDEYDQVLDRFYELHDWDRATSWQTRKCMTQLGLEDVATKLEKAGKLID